MDNNSEKISGFVRTFEEFALFCKNKWRASLLAIFVLAFLGAILLLLFYGYKKIELLGTELNKQVQIIEETHSTPDSLQQSLVKSVSDNLLIEKELSKILLNSHNGVSSIFFKFHNSKMDLQGKHDFFYSAMNEVSKSGDNHYMENAQNIPITQLGQYMIPFLDHKCEIVRTEDIKSNNLIRKKFDNEKIGTVAACPIYDISGKYLLGFVEIVYTTGVDPVRQDDDIKRNLNNFAVKLSFIISKEVSLIKEK